MFWLIMAAGRLIWNRMIWNKMIWNSKVLVDLKSNWNPKSLDDYKSNHRTQCQVPRSLVASECLRPIIRMPSPHDSNRTAQPRNVLSWKLKIWASWATFSVGLSFENALALPIRVLRKPLVSSTESIVTGDRDVVVTARWSRDKEVE